MRMAPSRHVQMTAKNFPSIGPMLRKRYSPPRGVGTVSKARPSNKLKAITRKSIPRSASTHSRFGSSQLNSTAQHTHDCTHGQDFIPMASSTISITRRLQDWRKRFPDYVSVSLIKRLLTGRQRPHRLQRPMDRHFPMIGTDRWSNRLYPSLGNPQSVAACRTRQFQRT
jgi:hypothetical protein